MHLCLLPRVVVIVVVVVVIMVVIRLRIVHSVVIVVVGGFVKQLIIPKTAIVSMHHWIASNAVAATNQMPVGTYGSEQMITKTWESFVNIPPL